MDIIHKSGSQKSGQLISMKPEMSLLLSISTMEILNQLEYIYQRTSFNM
jgi:hypothetical protein